MKLHKIWNYGQLFGYSGLEGPNRYYDDFILMTMAQPLSFRFEFKKNTATLSFPNNIVEFEAVMSDFVKASLNDKPFCIAFADNDTLVGFSPVAPVIKGEVELSHELYKGVDVFSLDNHYLAIKTKTTDCGIYFVIHHSFSASEAQAGADEHFNDDVNAIIQHFEAYYEQMPSCNTPEYEELYCKTLSVQKVNVHTPEGKIRYMWTTPDRVPHRHMWMWDSMFHGIAMSQYDPKHAEEIVLAMLSSMRKDGFMPHMANPTDRSDVTQPAVLSWAVKEIYQVTKNKKFLEEALPYLESYLRFDMNNRDENHNGLLEWATDPWYDICKCGESGLDNSPRFDFDAKMDCIDFSVYLANDAKSLAWILDELGESKKASYWKEVYEKTSKAINDLLWYEEGGYYCDRLFDGNLTGVLTPVSFLPLWAGIATKEQADRMAKVLVDEKLLNTPFPFASISQSHPTYSTDMWRGASWLNLDYFIITGLYQYGYKDLADQVTERILTKVDYWYKQCGTIFEFYDSQDKIAPWLCHRKGDPINPPDYRKHVHSISDYNWSACFTMLLIQKVYKR
ncbi:MAG: hypothetical protein MJ239_04040 [Bacilli bacterium]|nr:hypothetical protein [Bacilli bacterium]